MNKVTLTSLSFMFGLMIILMGISGCGEEPVDVEALMADGWTLYVAKDYAGAIGKFDAVIAETPDRAEAYVGLGWSYGKQSELSDCISSFQQALAKDSQNVDALAGIALAYLADDKYDLVITNANQALAMNPAYAFAHGNITSRHLHVALAESYYFKGDFASTQKEVDILNPGNVLDSSSETYVADLLVEIESAI